MIEGDLLPAAKLPALQQNSYCPKSSFSTAATSLTSEITE
jgi:hypothetical protein